MSHRLFALVLVPLAAACQEHSGEPDPWITNVMPDAWVVGSEPGDLTITGDGFFLKMRSDLREGSGVQVAKRFHAYVGELELEDLRWINNTSLVGRAPAGLAIGRYSVRVETPAGGVAVLEDALSVRSSSSSSTCDTSPPWAFAGWTSRWRVDLSFPASNETLHAFPAPVSVGAAELQGASPGTLRFSNAAGAALPFEIETTVGEEVVAWVLLPMIPTSGAVSIWMYAGNGGAAGAEAPATVWSEFEAVYHLGPVLADATGRFTVAENRGTTSATGRIGNARSFDGGSAIWLGADQPLLAGVTAWTASAWMRVGAASGWAHAFAISVGGMDQYSTTSRASICVLPPDTVQLIARAADNQVEVDNDATVPDVCDGSWHLLTGVTSYATDETLSYVDGTLVGVIDTMGFGQPASATTPSSTACIGAQDGCNGDYMVGALDEIRIAPVARSDAWIAAEYASMQGMLGQLESPETCSP